MEFLDLKTADKSLLSLEQAIHRFNPDVIGISVRNIDDQTMKDTKFLVEPIREVISHCRSISKAKIVLGGAGYSVYPERALTYLGADMGIRGEGEFAFPALLDTIQKGGDLSQVLSLYVAGKGLQGTRTFPKDLDMLPLPETSVLISSLSKKDDVWLPVQTRRGCPMDCSYCSTASIEGRAIRQRSPQKIVEEITRYRRMGFRQLYFVDNTFNLPAVYALDLCGEIIRADLDMAWQCIVYPIEIEPNLAKAMKNSGCRQAAIGFESGSERMLRALNKRFTLNDVRITCERLADNDIRRFGFLLLGGPGETRASVEESLAFADSLDLDELKISIGVRIYPDTELASIAVANGVVLPDDDLLLPRFYLESGIESWIYERINEWTAERS